MATISNNFGSQNTTEDVVFSARDLAVLNEIATVVSSATDTMFTRHLLLLLEK
jgi:hypothetical protein